MLKFKSANSKNEGIMKSKNAFTLIELLAIIVILAIIAVITVPIILNIIDNAKKGAAKDSAYGYKDAVNKWYVTKLQEDSQFQLASSYTISSDGKLGDIVIPISGDKPSGGYLNYSNNTLTGGCLVIGDYAVTFEGGNATSTIKGTCTSSVPTIASCPGCKFIFTTDYYAIEGTVAEEDYSSDMPTADDGLTNDYRNLQKEVDIWIADDDTEYYNEYECYEANNETDCESGTTSVQRTYFLGLIESTDSTKQGKIGRAFECGIENGTPFCLEGYDTSKWSDDYNVGILNTIFPSCNASASDSYADCDGSSVNSGADNDGIVYVNDGRGGCSVYDNGVLSCYGW